MLINWVCNSNAQCSLTNGAACACPDGTLSCLLLPDMIISETAITESGGYMEYSQSGNGTYNGQLRVTGATPNIGWGPIHVIATDTFFCGGVKSTSSPPPLICPDGSSPGQLLVQRIYRKDTTDISYIEVPSGIMSYHPSHSHLHIKNWISLSLRIKDNLEPDPHKWQIIGEIAKVSFCLADFDACTQANGYCRDSAGKILDNTNIPNFGMGDNYNNCSTEQGISPGYMDIYDKNVPGQSITIPYGTCNGDYWLLAEVDPDNYVVESNKSNNLTLIPITLTKQGTNAIANISAPLGNYLCQSQDTVILESSAGVSYEWSTGDTTRKIAVTQPGKYAVRVVTLCGVAFSDSFVVKKTMLPVLDSVQTDTLCFSGSALLSAYSKDSVNWYNQKDSIVFVGKNYSTSQIDTTTFFKAAAFNRGAPLDTFHIGKLNKTTPGTFYTGTDLMKFNCITPLTIKSVKVYADSSRFRIFRLWDSEGNELISNTFFVPQGESRVELNFYVPRGNGFQLICQAPKLWRDDVPAFPYRLPNFIELIGSGLDNYYPYMYDWEIIPDAGICGTQKQLSSQQTILVIVGKKKSLNITGLDTAYFNIDTTIALTGIPPGGVFSGTGVSSDTFNPSAATIGLNVVLYTYTDTLGCTDTLSQTVSVKDVTSIKEILIGGISVFPNPSSGQFSLISKNTASSEIKIYNNLGESVLTELLQGEQKRQIDLSSNQSGIYFLVVNSNNKTHISKLVLIKN